MGETMSTADDELAQIRAARQAEIQQQIEAQAEQQIQAEAQEAAAEEEASIIAAAMRTILTPEARDRLARVELGHPELATTVNNICSHYIRPTASTSQWMMKCSSVYCKVLLKTTVGRQPFVEFEGTLWHVTSPTPRRSALTR